MAQGRAVVRGQGPGGVGGGVELRGQVLEGHQGQGGGDGQRLQDERDAGELHR